MDSSMTLGDGYRPTRVALTLDFQAAVTVGRCPGYLSILTVVYPQLGGL
jgi:hypothetical protein